MWVKHKAGILSAINSGNDNHNSCNDTEAPKLQHADITISSLVKFLTYMRNFVHKHELGKAH